MGDKSKIEWTDASWNVVVGCTYASPGCLRCYARVVHDRRYLAWKRGSYPSAPEQYHRPFKAVQVFPERLALPLHWRRPRRIFVNSLSDLFHEDVPDDVIDRTFAVMAAARQHTYQILTKRPERMRRYVHAMTPRRLAAAWSELGQFGEEWGDYIVRNCTEAMVDGDTLPWPLPNVWLGVSVEDQTRADERIPLLLGTPSTVRFLSCEPLVGPVTLPLPNEWEVADWERARSHGDGAPTVGLDWCIIGGESGHGARPLDLEWVRALVRQCRAAGVAVFVKQLGEVYARDHGGARKGGDMDTWPEDLRVREYPIGLRA